MIISVAVVARTGCGERVLIENFDRTIDVALGAPAIVLQDRYDIEISKRILASNSGEYLSHIFDGRYRIFDVATGAKLIDRAGHNPNFSPTSRFIAAQAGDS